MVSCSVCGGEIVLVDDVWVHSLGWEGVFHYAVPPGHVCDYLYVMVREKGSSIVFSCDGSPDGLRRVVSEMGVSVVGATFYKVHGRPIEGSKLWEWGGFSFPIGVKNAILGQQ